MTSLRGLWMDCDEWDRRYLAEVERTNMRSIGPPRPGSLLAENGDDPGAAPTAPGRADTPAPRDREGEVST